MPSSGSPLLLVGGAGLWLAALLLTIAAAQAPATHGLYPDAPVPGHTGGFGEPTCLACHFDGTLNPPGGSLTIEGWPEQAVADSTYRLLLSVRHEQLALGGFQAAVRFGDGSQAGAIEPADERTMIIEGDNGLAYAQHSAEGTQPLADREAAWEIRWTPSRGGDAWLHVAANAANGDRSEFGDHVYAASLHARVAW